MKRSKVKFIKVVILCVLLLLLSATLLVIRAKAQDDVVEGLRNRLLEQSVPVKNIIVQNRFPFQIEITIQLNDEIKDISSDDTWIMHLAYREALLSHRIGVNLDSFTLIVLDELGERISWEQVYLYSDSLFRQPFISDATKLDNEVAEKIFRDSLDFNDMQIQELDVSTGAGSRDDVQTLVIKLFAQNTDIAINAFPKFISSVLSQLDRINSENETVQIAICRIWVVDDSERILIKFIYDLEVRRQILITADDLPEDLFPNPGAAEPEVEPPTPTFDKPSDDDNATPYPPPMPYP